MRAENGGADGSDAEEEYFEEFHLPNTHENAFVRHQSFRRKVELTPINAPDAEKIEGLVRTGEFERHGSMRRKIVANVSGTDADEAGLYKLEEDEADNEAGKQSMQEFSEDFREIEKMMDDNGLGSAQESSYIPRNSAIVGTKLGHLGEDATPRLLMMRGKNAFTSTPNTQYASTADYASIDLSASLHDHSLSNNKSCSVGEHNDMESLSIEQSTINKVKECMDFSKCKDIYSLTGKLQDMLTPVEMEEVLNNSHRYVDYIDSGVLEALFNSISEQMSMTGQPMSISFNKPDVSRLKRVEARLTPEEIELQNKIRQKLLMEELAMDSLPYINIHEASEDSHLVNIVDAEIAPSEVPAVQRREKKSSQDNSGSDGEGIKYNTIERRKSVRVSRVGNSQQEVEGVFVESDFQNTKLKLIAAPAIDLLNSASQEDLDESELGDPASLDDSGIGHLQVGVDKELQEPSAFTDEGSHASIPSIRITRTESSREDDNSSINNLYVGDDPLSASSDTTSLDFNEPGACGTCRPSKGGRIKYFC